MYKEQNITVDQKCWIAFEFFPQRPEHFSAVGSGRAVDTVGIELAFAVDL
jgi:hypothetical protein